MAALCFALVLAGSMPAHAADPLPSWNDGPARQRIMGFVHSVTEPGGKDFVPPAERIAVFDNDGTLWAEQPMYVQLAFAIDRARTLPEIDFIDDKAGKPVAIQKFIGRRPILAVGNSDGDFEMLEWTTAASGPRLGVLLHHDDAGREFAYDRAASFGRLARGLDEAQQRGWLVVGMHDDWNAVFAAP